MYKQRIVTREIYIFIQQRKKYFLLICKNANYETTISSLFTVALSFEHILLFPCLLLYFYIYLVPHELCNHFGEIQKGVRNHYLLTCPFFVGCKNWDDILNFLCRLVSPHDKAFSETMSEKVLCIFRVSPTKLTQEHAFMLFSPFLLL